MQIRFRQEIAILWDTIYSFRVQYNRERFEKLAEDEESVRTELQMLPLFEYVAKRELAPFFCYLQEKHCFMQQCVEEYLTKNSGDSEKIGMRSFLEYLQDSRAVIVKMLRYYLPGIGEKEANDLLDNPAKLVLKLRSVCDCSEEIKNDLLVILLNPETTMHQLMYELTEREQQMKLLYQKKADQITGLMLNFTEEHIRKCWGDDAKHPAQLDGIEEVVVGFCAFQQKLFYEQGGANRLIWVLGKEYEKVQFPEESEENDGAVLAAFVMALGEKNRLTFFNYIFEHEGTTGKELEKIFGMTGPNVYYHLGNLSKGGLVRSETKGRNVIYTVDKNTIRKVREYLKRYEKGE